MTLKELANILSAVPEEWDEATVYLAGGEDMCHARAVVLVPLDSDEPDTPRIELHTGVANLPVVLPAPEDFEKADVDPPDGPHDDQEELKRKRRKRKGK